MPIRIVSVNPSESCRIISYVHCTRCIEEKPDGISPQEWQDASIGVTGDAQIQVWCNRHNVNIAVLSATEEDEES